MHLIQQRQEAILERLTTHGRVVAGHLARDFNTSEDTIRRDLRDLAAAGHCRRVYGGALPVSPAGGPLRTRLESDHALKAALGRAAAGLVRPDDTILIDAGSTNLCIAQALPSSLNLTVITNAPSVAAALADRTGIGLVVIGGRVDPQVGASCGAKACADLAEIRPDLAFIGACAVDARGLCAFDADDSAFKRLAIRQAQRSVAAVQSSKLATRAPFAFAEIAALDRLVVEHDASASTLQDLGVGPDQILRADPAAEASR